MDTKKSELEEYLEKSASPWNTNFKNTALGAAGVATVGMAAAGLSGSAETIYNAATKSRDFRSMLEHNTDLQEHHEADPKRFNLMFTTLRNMNPEFSKDPLVAGAYMRRMVEAGPMAGGVAVEALTHRDTFGTPSRHAFIRGSQEGARGALTESMRYKTLDEERPKLDYQHQRALDIEGQRAVLQAKARENNAAGRPPGPARP